MVDHDGIIEHKEDRIIRLEKLLADFKRALYGAKSEKANPDQYHLALEDIETAMAVVHAEDEAIDPPKTAAPKSRVGRGVLPKHLPRVEEVIARHANAILTPRAATACWAISRLKDGLVTFLRGLLSPAHFASRCLHTSASNAHSQLATASSPK
jgi:hypothetical protein